ncbi:uncharacterized protein MEPE_06251 [Melanopsichium pennsylvanicum]|uniref:Transmembrane protein n=2 Tax=Melanopsichium pennsylvanicum TaxID=63383 RepID=A0AAJ5C827_9BASI|nr:hypothetical protein BN887_04323 [Melanopsichium pennsylvanicum 4]SNX87541.1 uncharacterized protein MEPE_06251 [Melanopsichium pennsylvanicum]
MYISFKSSVMRARDAVDDQQAAAMATWSARIAYAINYVVLYLTMSLTAVVVVGIMGWLALSRVRRSPSFIILLVCSALSICAVGVSNSMNKDVIVHREKRLNASLYTTSAAIAMSIPFLVDFTLILRILAFFPYKLATASGRSRYTRWVTIALATLLPAIRAEQHRQRTAVTPTHIFRSQGHTNKFLTTHHSFDTDEEKDIDHKIPSSSSTVDLAVLEQQAIATLKHCHNNQDARPRSPEPKPITLDRDELEGVSVQRMFRPQNPLRHAPDVSGIAVTTVTEEKWSKA